MSIAQRLPAADVRPRPWVTGLRLPPVLLGRAASFIGHALLGSGGGPRGYRREGFPDHELYQIVAGRKDRFDGLR